MTVAGASLHWELGSEQDALFFELRQFMLKPLLLSLT
jgi:hypothetical protein